MSIMDHDPKYAKLRRWREERGIVQRMVPPIIQHLLVVRLSASHPGLLTQFKQIGETVEALTKEEKKQENMRWFPTPTEK